MEEKIKLLKMPEDLLTRSVNVGFSGGEKKRNDILQMAVLEPSCAFWMRPTPVWISTP
jgi:Fe-S cluster assembly ATP-binding protein